MDAEKDLFADKLEKERVHHQQQLKDHLAHKHVLHDIAKNRITDSATGARLESHLGHYGPGSSKLEIQGRIEQTLKVL